MVRPDQGFHAGLTSGCSGRRVGWVPRPRPGAGAGIPQLVEAMRGLRPALIVVVMKAIEKDVAQAVREAGLGDVETRVLCFPARGHERKYVAGLTELISASTARGSHHAC